VADIAYNSGIRALAIHGRTRACLFGGTAEYDTIAAVKAQGRLPVIANGDIATPEQARAVLEHTGADAVMIGRAAQGRPWIFREIAHYLRTGQRLPAPPTAEIHAITRGHLQDLHAFYGETAGVKIARKHIGWYTRALPQAAALRARFNQLESSAAQLAEVDRYFERLAQVPNGEVEEALAA
jgi:tRNA-dihydrouridine synthase B